MRVRYELPLLQQRWKNRNKIYIDDALSPTNQISQYQPNFTISANYNYSTYNFNYNYSTYNDNYNYSTWLHTQYERSLYGAEAKKPVRVGMCIQKVIQVSTMTI